MRWELAAARREIARLQHLLEASTQAKPDKASKATALDNKQNKLFRV